MKEAIKQFKTMPRFPGLGLCTVFQNRLNMGHEKIFSRVHATLYSVWSVGLSVGNQFTRSAAAVAEVSLWRKKKAKAASR